MGAGFDAGIVQRHIAQRAQEIFRARGGTIGHAVEDWIKAERETVWRPALEVRRTKNAFVVEAAVAGIDPKKLDVQVTPTELVLSAPVHHSDREQEGDVVLCEFANGPLFRTFKFAEPVDPARVSAENRNGMLRVTAPLAQPATKVEVQAAERLPNVGDPAREFAHAACIIPTAHLHSGCRRGVARDGSLRRRTASRERTV